MVWLLYILTTRGLQVAALPCNKVLRTLWRTEVLQLDNETKPLTQKYDTPSPETATIHDMGRFCRVWYKRWRTQVLL